MPLYVLGLMGATRRMDHYDNPAWQPLFVVAAAGAAIIAAGIVPAGAAGGGQHPRSASARAT